MTGRQRKALRAAGATAIAVLVLAGCDGTTDEPGELAELIDAPVPADTTTTGAIATDDTTATPSVSATTRPTTPVPTTGITAVRVGEVAQSYGVTLVVDRIEFSVCDNDPYRAPLPGHTILSVEMRLTNHDNPYLVDYGAFAWTLTERNGATYTPSILTCVERPPNPALTPGVTVATHHEFEIPGDATGLVLRWDGLGPGHTVTVDLGT